MTACGYKPVCENWHIPIKSHDFNELVDVMCRSKIAKGYPEHTDKLLMKTFGPTTFFTKIIFIDYRFNKLFMNCSVRFLCLSDSGQFKMLF